MTLLATGSSRARPRWPGGDAAYANTTQLTRTPRLPRRKPRVTTSVARRPGQHISKHRRFADVATFRRGQQREGSASGPIT